MYENQGLVRRMYGDLQHIFVLKSDLDHHENEISWDDIKHGADKYLKTFNTHNSERQMKAANSKLVVETKNLRSNDILEQPHFRPTTNKHSLSSSNGNANKLKPTKQQNAFKAVAENASLFENIIKDLLEFQEKRDKTENPSNIFLISKTTKLTSVTPAAVSTTTKVKVSLNKTEENDSKATTTNDIDGIKAPENLDKYVIDTFGNNSIGVSSSDVSSTTLKTTTTQKTTTHDSQETPLKLSSTLKNNRPKDDEEESEEAIITEILNFELNDNLKDSQNSVSSTDESESEKDKNKWNGSANANKNSSNNKKNSMDTQLFQDTFQKDKDQQPQFNKRGV